MRSGDFAAQNYILVKVGLPPAIGLFESAALSTTQAIISFGNPENSNIFRRNG
jgi:hypothetical protein